MAQVWLFAYQGGQAVAWSDDGRDFFEVGTGKPFAWRQDDWLYAYGTSSPMGWFQGRDFFQHPGGAALYFLQ